ncbi:MAG: pilus assembly protein [Actinobacteria bacterium]|nr:pilus assembly protein [Actinomycetota bacterium]
MVGHAVEVAADDSGAAVVEFVMVSVLLIFLLFAVLQVALVFYARNVIAESASDAARYTSGSSLGPEQAGERAQAQLRSVLGDRLAGDIHCIGSREIDVDSGLQTTVVRCQGRLRASFAPIGAFVEIATISRALTEPSQ